MIDFTLIDTDYLFCGQMDLECSTQVGTGLRFEKQVMYADTFHKPLGNGKYQDIVVTSRDMDMYAQSTNKYIIAGKVTVPIEHTEDLEKNRGYVAKLLRKRDKKGRDSLYAVVDFRDKDAAKLANSSCVSVFIPPYIQDGKKVLYPRSMKHLALTNDPILPGLENFQCIAASFNGPIMTIMELAKKLGFTPAEGTSDEALGTMIFNAVSQLQEKLKKAMAGDKPADKPAQGDPVVASLLKENREGKIDGLLRDNKITPAVSKTLKEKWCSEECISASLKEGSQTSDAFKDVVDTLALSHGVLSNTDGSSTGPQLEDDLGDDVMDETKNPLLADMNTRTS